MDNEYFVSINEVSKRLDVPAHTLRYWEKQFPVIIRPTTGAGGRRYYRHETITRLRVIQDLLYNRGMTIAGVKKLIREGNLPKDVGIAPVFGDGAPGAKNSTGVAARTVVDPGVLNDAIDLLRRAREILNQ